MQKISVAVFLSTLMLASQVHAENAFMAPLASKSLLLDIEKIGEHAYVTVGERGHILLSDDAIHWQQQVVPTNQMLTAVSFIDAEHGWAVGHDALILATTDGGHSWAIQNNQPELEKPLMDVHFFSQQHGIAVGAYGLFFRTRDGGKTWSKELHGELLLADDISYLDELKAEDENLYLQELASVLPHFNQLSDEVNGRIYLAGEMGLLAFSDDQGQNWQRMEVDYTGSFFAVNQTLNGGVIAAGLRGNLFELHQGKWQRIRTQAKTSINAIVPVDGETTLLVGNNGRILTLKDHQVSMRQTDEGQAIIDAVIVGDMIVAATEAGIKEVRKD